MTFRGERIRLTQFSQSNEPSLSGRDRSQHAWHSDNLDHALHAVSQNRQADLCSDLRKRLREQWRRNAVDLGQDPGRGTQPTQGPGRPEGRWTTQDALRFPRPRSVPKPAPWWRLPSACATTSSTAARKTLGSNHSMATTNGHRPLSAFCRKTPCGQDRSFAMPS